MPNWCNNDITITGPEKTVQTIASLMGLMEEKPSFDFNKVISYPDKFREQDELAVEARKNGDYSFEPRHAETLREGPLPRRASALYRGL